MTIEVPHDGAAARFRSLVDHLGAIVWEAVPGPERGHARLTYVSEGSEALLGYAAERWTSDPGFWLSTVHPDDRERVRTQVGAAIVTGIGTDLEYRSTTESGREIWLRNILRVQDDHEGRRLHGVIVDVTEQREADARLHRLQELTDALSRVLTAREIAAIVARQGRRAVGAAAVAVFLRVAEDELEISGYDGFADEAIEEFCRLPLDRDVPAAEAARTGERIILDTEAFDRRYPGARDWRRLGGRGQFIALPLNLGDRTFGSLAIRMPEEQTIGAAEHLVLDVLGRSCAQALQRAETIAAVREADAMLDTIITTAPEGFALFDTELRYVRVNDALAAINGVPAAEHAGRTLQQIVPDIPVAGAEGPLRRVLETGEPVVDVEVTGHTAGDPERAHTWLTSYYPVAGADGRPAWLGAFVVDITARKDAEKRSAMLAADNAELYELERIARDRTERQYAVAAALADALTPPDVATAILSEVVDAVGAEKGTVWQVSEDGVFVELIGQRGFAEAELAAHQRVSLREHRPVADAIRERRTLTFDTSTENEAVYPQFAGTFARSGIESAIVIPLLSAGRAVGGLFLSCSRRYAFGDGEQALAAALAAQAAQALERARLFEAERRVSVTLQRSLLPAHLPEIDGLELAVRYVPAAGLEAGGDFYEALPLPGGAVGIAVGDVVGRGATAAASMGQLRSALRAFAMVGEDPGAVLTRLSTFADTVGGAMAATAIVARLRPDTGELRYACAGHPWPLLVHRDGSAEYLTEGRGVPLACVAAPEFPEGTARLRPGSTLLLYTDGLTERRGHDLESVLERLRSAASRAAGAPLDELLDRALAETGDAAPADDVALVAVRLASDPTMQTLRFAAEAAQVPVARAALRQWLQAAGVPPDPAGAVLLATGEAVANAVEHSAGAEVAMELSLPAPGVVAVTVSDRGRWKDPVIAPHRGRGFGLMRMLLDEVTVERGDRGTVARLRHRFGDAPAGSPEAPVDEAPCTVQHRDGVAVVRGELDLAGAARIRDDVVAGDPHTIDLSGVGFLDLSSTLGS